MCGIFGWIASEGSSLSEKIYHAGLKELFLLSETRGKEASGVCFISDKEVEIYKECIRAKKLIHSEQFKHILEKTGKSSYYTMMGHARMVTNGSSSVYENNQPVEKDDLICIHNGIIVNDLDLWKKYPDMKRQSEVDTEVFLSLLQKYDYQSDLISAFKNTLGEIKGSLSIALVDKTREYLLLYTNVGSLYLVVSNDKKMILFASERYILEHLILKQKLEGVFQKDNIQKITPKCGKIINMRTCAQADIFSEECDALSITKNKCQRKELREKATLTQTSITPKMLSNSQVREIQKMLYVDESKIKKLRRCTKCLLPETFPGIRFNENGVCSICQNYKRKEVKGEKALRSILTEQKISNANYDCIVPLSGGRDSCYLLHYVVKELGLKPVAYTYDWGMVTDLARRNIQRMCSELEVEHILISADIKKKRKNISLNVNAWLKKPNLATVPLFMAGDKQFFYYAQMLKKQMKVNHILFGMNSLEETKFKVAFTGTKEKEGKDLYYNMSIKNKLDLLKCYGHEFIVNPAYLNRSLLDSLFGFISYYMLPQDYTQFFDYVQWEQSKVEDVILNQYDWEMAKDTKDTWRIGDGTAAFYNYIYYRLAGFTEFDTFKSNQIREGMLDRNKALEEVYESNQVRPESFAWYCNTIGIDPLQALIKINSQKTLYDEL